VGLRQGEIVERIKDPPSLQPRKPPPERQSISIPISFGSAAAEVYFFGGNTTPSWFLTQLCSLAEVAEKRDSHT
jgi:hypothetical protein